jgi:phosphatidylcholine synthase
MPSARESDAGGTVLQRAEAFAVHIFTASGAALALLAMLAATEHRWTQMFGWLGAAMVVDGADGIFARRLAVRQVVPRWSGDVLDLVVDVLTYVFVPACAIVGGGLLPEPVAVTAGVLIVCTSVLYFADTRMKTAEHYFRGFPATWNLVAFYLFVLRPEPWLAFGIVIGLCVLTFVPVKFVHPMRVRSARLLNLVLLGTACVFALLALAADLAPAPWVTAGLSVLGLYFLFTGLWRGG